MDLLKKHVDTVVLLGAVLCSVLWMNTKFNELEKEIVMIKTVMILRNIMPIELAKCSSTEEEGKK